MPAAVCNLVFGWVGIWLLLLLLQWDDVRVASTGSFSRIWLLWWDARLAPRLQNSKISRTADFTGREQESLEDCLAESKLLPLDWHQRRDLKTQVGLCGHSLGWKQIQICIAKHHSEEQFHFTCSGVVWRSYWDVKASGFSGLETHAEKLQKDLIGLGLWKK